MNNYSTIDYYEAMLESDYQLAEENLREAERRMAAATEALETYRNRKRPWWQ